MINLVKAAKPVVLDCGDILSGSDYISRVYDLGDSLPIGRLIPLKILGNNPWSCLEKLGIQSDELKKISKYLCPFNPPNIYYHFLPVALVQRGSYDYHLTEEQLSYADWVLSRNLEFDLNSIETSYMGHGYTMGTLPCDGSGKWFRSTIDLDNGDQIYGYCWVWYNK